MIFELRMRIASTERTISAPRSSSSTYNRFRDISGAEYHVHKTFEEQSE